MRTFSKFGWGILVLMAFLCSGCGAAEGDSGGGPGSGGAVSPNPQDRGGPSLESWALSEAPILEIGVREGEDPYLLHRVRGSVRLEDGRVVVLNAGSQELRYYDQAGFFLKSVGRIGEGPGEFQDPAGFRRAESGGFRVWDRGLMRITLLDTAGTYQEFSRLQVSREELFPGDDWLMGPNWVVAPLPPPAREQVRSAVRAMPPPDSTSGLRALIVTPQGRIWSSGTRLPAETPTNWVVFDLQGNPMARVTTPPRFHLHEIGEGYVTGLFLDEVDVNYVHVYALEKPPGSPQGPGLDYSVGGGADPPQAAYVAAEDEVLAEMKALLKNMASLQEIHYATHYTYTSDLDELFSDPRRAGPGELMAEVLFAGQDGWALRVGDPESDAQCIIGYGLFVPMGWRPGELRCF